MNNLALTNANAIIGAMQAVNMVDEEREAELSNLRMLELRKQDVITSPLGKVWESKSKGRTKRFFNDMDEDKKQLYSFLTNVPETINLFKDYWLDSVKGKEKAELEQAFTDDGFLADIRNLLVYDIYDEKWNLSIRGKVGFVSGEAQGQYSYTAVMKHNEKGLYKAIGVGKKQYIHMSEHENRVLSKSQQDQYKRLMVEVFDEVLKAPEEMRLLSSKSNIKKIG